MMEAVTTAQRPLRLLSLDGGGIRGLSILIILQELMHRVQKDRELSSIPLPADYFDIICGTSTGGLIALLLGRLRLSVDESIKVYGAFAKEVFGGEKWIWQDGKFKARKLEEAIKRVIEDKLGPGHADEKMFMTNNQGCKTFVCAVPGLHVGTLPRLFRTWEAKKNPDYNCTIWEAARATSAAPTFFKRISIGEDGLQEEFIDAGLGCNNPTSYLVREAQREFGSDRKVGCIVSIGTGRLKVSGFRRPGLVQRVIPTQLIEVLKTLATDTERIASTLKEKYQNCPGLYHRLNVDKGLEEISLAEWKELGAVKTHTMQYLRGNDAGKSLDAIVEALVNKSTSSFTLGQLDEKLPNENMIEEYHFNFPARQVIYYVARITLQNDIQRFFREPHLSSMPKIVVLCGMGGCGKSQLALQYCQCSAYEKSYKAIFWIDAISPRSIEQSFLTIAREISARSSNIEDTGENVRFVLTTLERWDEPWLLIFDNHDDLALFSTPIKQFFPRSNKGSVLITSRDVEAKALGHHHIDVSMMSLEEAKDLLCTRSEIIRNDENLCTVEKIVKRLGLHALAIDQAGAYIQGRMLQLDHFLDQYSRRREMLEETPAVWNYRRKVSPGNEMETDLSVFTTFELSYALITGDEDARADKEDLLTSIAFFDGKEISDTLFKPFSTQAPDWLTSCRTDGVWDGDKCQDILKELRRFSLLQTLKIDNHGAIFSLHPLVQDWLKLRISSELQQKYTKEASCILSMFMREQDPKEKLPSTRQTTMLHFEAVTQNMKTYLNSQDHLKCEAILDFAGQGVQLLASFGQMKAVEDLCRRRLEALAKLQGQEDPETVRYAINLAQCLSNRQKFVEALPMCRQMMELGKKILDERDPAIYIIMITSVEVLTHLGEYTEAESILQKVSSLEEKVFGRAIPESLTMMNAKANLLIDQGKYREACSIYQQVIAKFEKFLGKEHILTLTTMLNFVLALNALQEFRDAEIRCKETYTLLEKVHGKTHQTTIMAISLLADILLAERKYEEAEPYFSEALALSRNFLDEGHRLNLSNIYGFATTLACQGKYNVAEMIHKEALSQHGKVLGEKDPKTLRIFHGLANVLALQGKLTLAEPLFRQTWTLQREVLGKDNPETLETAYKFAACLIQQGKNEVGEPILMETLALKMKAMENPDSFVSEDGLARLVKICRERREGSSKNGASQDRLTRLKFGKVFQTFGK